MSNNKITEDTAAVSAQLKKISEQLACFTSIHCEMQTKLDQIISLCQREQKVQKPSVRATTSASSAPKSTAAANPRTTLALFVMNYCSSEELRKKINAPLDGIHATEKYVKAKPNDKLKVEATQVYEYIKNKADKKDFDEAQAAFKALKNKNLSTAEESASTTTDANAAQKKSTKKPTAKNTESNEQQKASLEKIAGTEGITDNLSGSEDEDDDEEEEKKKKEKTRAKGKKPVEESDDV
jgi:hypothetical protein